MPQLIKKYRIRAFSLFLVFGLFSNSVFTAPISNQLRGHPAPYLALHGDDPVAWQLWDIDTVKSAREQNKIIFLSIGYFSCHWCHVMQKESYQNSEVAKIVNEHFIPVKIDRELEPALDSRLMSFTQRILGRGGWPLNVFITPDGYPIYSLLYAPPAQFLATLDRLHTLWATDREKVLNVVKNEVVKTYPDAEPRIDPLATRQILQPAVTKIMERADQLSGGFGNSQKFPSVPQLAYLLERYAQSPDSENRAFLETTLKAMAELGLHDHLLGGFFRYSVDPGWEIPHFEKMLYDNANLANLYLTAARVLENKLFEEVAKTTLKFMSEEMWHQDGAMVSAFSAVDDEGIEGGSYLWTTSQIKSALSSQEFELVTALWGLNRPSDLGAGNHLRFISTPEQYASQSDLSVDEVQHSLFIAKEKLMNQRRARSLPVDDKLLAGWNGLALSAFIQADLQFPDQGYSEVAERLREFLVNRLWDGEQLHRSLVKGKIIGAPSLEDYAYVAKALYEWAEVSKKDEDYRLVKEIVTQGWNRFYRNNGWYEGDDTLLAPTSGEEIISDSSNLSPSATLIDVSLKLSGKINDAQLRNKALSALNRGEAMLTVAPFWHVTQLTALETALSGSSFQ